jgi:hypothetical protein
MVLSALAESVLGGDSTLIEEVRRRAMEHLGARGWMDALLVISFFQMMDRVANGSGVQLEANVVQASGFIGELGLTDFGSAANTPKLTLRQRIMARPIRRLFALYIKQQRERRLAGDAAGGH